MFEPSPFIKRCWHHALNHYGRYPFGVRLTREVLSRMLKDDPEWGRIGYKCSESEIDRARKWAREHGHPEWFPWPFRKGMCPPWELKPEAAPVTVVKLEDMVPKDYDRVHWDATDSQGQPATVEAVREKDGVILRVVPKIMPLLAALYTGASMLDVLDGRQDGIITWCRLLAHAMRMHL